MSRSRIVFGVGINDADYVVQKNVKVNGKWVRHWICPYYSRWVDMLRRCYSEREIKRKPTYALCTVCDEWLYFMAFRKWMVKHAPVLEDGELSWQLDKDLLFTDNLVYSAETCLFVPSRLNKLLLDTGSKRGDYSIGVFKKDDKFIGQCSENKGKQTYLGVFFTEQSAHKAWQITKMNVIQKELDLVTAGFYDKRNEAGELLKVSELLRLPLLSRIEKLAFDIAENRETVSL